MSLYGSMQVNNENIVGLFVTLRNDSKLYAHPNNWKATENVIFWKSVNPSYLGTRTGPENYVSTLTTDVLAA